jgi:hypothetical protein
MVHDININPIYMIYKFYLGHFSMSCCETWSLTLKEGHGLRVLRTIFELKRKGTDRMLEKTA